MGGRCQTKGMRTEFCPILDALRRLVLEGMKLLTKGEHLWKFHHKNQDCLNPRSLPSLKVVRREWL